MAILPWVQSNLIRCDCESYGRLPRTVSTLYLSKTIQRPDPLCQISHEKLKTRTNIEEELTLFCLK